ncbi:hypothetical protein HG530_006530 [Fusarium avenaceum]|nr:hypothetical protein HG530_006530 [Fusarium avenaceum]
MDLDKTTADFGAGIYSLKTPLQIVEGEFSPGGNQGVIAGHVQEESRHYAGGVLNTLDESTDAVEIVAGLGNSTSNNEGDISKADVVLLENGLDIHDGWCEAKNVANGVLVDSLVCAAATVQRKTNHGGSCRLLARVLGKHAASPDESCEGIGGRDVRGHLLISLEKLCIGGRCSLFQLFKLLGREVEDVAVGHRGRKLRRRGLGGERQLKILGVILCSTRATTRGLDQLGSVLHGDLNRVGYGQALCPSNMLREDLSELVDRRSIDISVEETYVEDQSALDEVDLHQGVGNSLSGSRPLAALASLTDEIGLENRSGEVTTLQLCMAGEV